MKNPAGCLTALTVFLKTCPESSVTPLFCWYEKYSACLVEGVESHLFEKKKNILKMYFTVRWMEYFSYQQNTRVCEDSGRIFKTVLRVVKQPAGFFKLCLEFIFEASSARVRDWKSLKCKNGGYMKGTDWS